MSVPDPNFYAKWRAQNEARALLREKDAPHPPERLLQSIWHHQRLRRDQLQTVDGRPVRVLHPGFWNHEAGPDFRGAVVGIGSDPARSGDIEIDLSPENWRSHQHAGNPAFANVILHVVWNTGGNSGHALPSLALEPFLDSPLAEIQTWTGSGSSRNWPEELLGACNAPLRDLSPEQTMGLLRQAADIRFQRKARELEARARQAGWEQALWEGLFRALGYKQNVWPMQRLAELLPRCSGGTDTASVWQARLLGLSGLLPDDPNEYVRGLWDQWWRERDRFSDAILPKTLWRFNGLRPANQPQRRLALASHWLASRDFIPKLEQWFAGDKSQTPLPESLLACLQAPLDDFWSWHWGFRSPRLPDPQPLLGATRATDLAVNVILPWFWVRAQTGKNHYLEEVARERYLAWPAAQDNVLLRLARQRLLGRRLPGWINTAAAQQGLMQIVRDFCDHSNAVCANCNFPDLVRNWTNELKTV